MKKTKKQHDKGDTLPICSKWENRYYYIMLELGNSHVLRFNDLSDTNILPTIQPVSDSSVIAMENEIIQHEEFIAAYEKAKKMWDNLILIG